MVDDEDIDVDVEIFAVLSITFFISAIVFCMSPRSCLTAATLLDLEDEDDEDVTLCDWVAMCVLAIWTLDDDVLLLHTAEADTLEFLLLEVVFKSSCDALILELDIIDPVVDPVPASDDALPELNRFRFCPRRCDENVGVPLTALVLLVSVKTDSCEEPVLALDIIEPAVDPVTDCDDDDDALLPNRFRL